MTVWGVNTSQKLATIPTRVEPEGMVVSPDGETIVGTSETTNLGHFIDYKAGKMTAAVLVGACPRNARFEHDGSEVWVSSELGGTVSVIDPTTHKIRYTISFPVQGLRGDEIQPEDIQFTKDDAVRHQQSPKPESVPSRLEAACQVRGPAQLRRSA